MIINQVHDSHKIYINDYPYVNPEYFSRKKYEIHLKKILRDKGIIVVYGSMGSGKTTLVSRVLKEVELNEKSVLWINTKKEKDIINNLQTYIKKVDNLNKFSDIHNNKNISFSSWKIMGNRRKTFSHKKLIVLDGLDRNVNSKLIKSIKKEYKKIKNEYNIIITTRHLDKQFNKCSKLYLPGLVIEDARELVNKKFANISSTINNFQKFFKIVNGNPLILKTIEEYYSEQDKNYYEYFSDPKLLVHHPGLKYLFFDKYNELNKNEKELLGDLLGKSKIGSKNNINKIKNNLIENTTNILKKKLVCKGLLSFNKNNYYFEPYNKLFFEYLFGI